MLSLTLGQLLHEERQREIERRLATRRLMEPQARPEPPVVAHPTPPAAPAGCRQTPAGATP